jgi:hypothetical protein
MTRSEYILIRISDLEKKITYLKAILALQPFSKVNFFFYGSNGTFCGLDQSNFDFNMAAEVKIFIEDSIQTMETDIIAYKNIL